MLLYLIFPNTQESEAPKFTQPDMSRITEAFSFSPKSWPRAAQFIAQFTKQLPLGKKRYLFIFKKSDYFAKGKLITLQVPPYVLMFSSLNSEGRHSNFKTSLVVEPK